MFFTMVFQFKLFISWRPGGFLWEVGRHQRVCRLTICDDIIAPGNIPINLLYASFCRVFCFLLTRLPHSSKHPVASWFTEECPQHEHYHVSFRFWLSSKLKTNPLETVCRSTLCLAHIVCIWWNNGRGTPFLDSFAPPLMWLAVLTRVTKLSALHVQCPLIRPSYTSGLAVFYATCGSNFSLSLDWIPE